MAKRNLIIAAFVAALAFVPAGVALANTAEVSVSVAAVASIESVEKEVEDGITTYTATVATNSSTGYNLYVSSNGEDWALVKSVDFYPTGDDLKGTVKVTAGSVEFKVEPRK